MFDHEIDHFLHGSSRQFTVDGSAISITADAAGIFLDDGVDRLNIGWDSN